MGELKAALLPVTPYQQNCTFLWDDATKQAVVIDPGGEVEKILDAIDQLGLNVETILLTHGHMDHAGGADELRAALRDRAGDPAAAPVVGPDSRDEFLLANLSRQGAATGLADARNVQPDRGHIYSDDGRLLATSVPEYEVHMDMRAEGLTEKMFFSGVDSLSLGLSALFNDRTAAEYKRALLDAHARGERYFLVNRKVDHEQMLILQELPIYREGRSKSGMVAEKHYERRQWFGRLARRTIGDARSDLDR